jgi:putative transposase
MAQRKRHTPEQAVTLLRQIGAGVANGKATSEVCKELEITVRTYYRWRRVYGGLEENQARRLRQLEQENANLKRLVSELCLQKLVLRDLIASGRL